MNNNTTIFTFIIVILVIIFIYFSLQADTNTNYKPNINYEITNNYNKERPPIMLSSKQEEVYIPQFPQNSIDIIRNYDYNKIDDPLVEPTRRVPRHEIHPHIMKQMIDIPTRGYPDNFTQYGVLTRMNKDNNTNEDNYDNKIIRLFGRQEYPGSYKHEYYTTVNSGNDQIKIPINTKNRKELYDGDKVRVDELHGTYEVKLHKYDAPKYYPDILY